MRRHDTVILPIYALHRHHQLWDNPDVFDPDRFLTQQQRFSYLPFVDGPRICIGASFASQEAVTILATLLARFTYSLIPRRALRPVTILTLRLQGSIWLAVKPV